MELALSVLKDGGLLDPGILAAGIEHGWATRTDVVAYAMERMSAGNDRPEAVELAAAENLESERIVDLLREWARLDGLPSQQPDSAVRRWMFAALTAISWSDAGAEEKLDRLEETYATFGYPEEMRECSRYYVPPQDRARDIRVGEVTASPLEAMNQLLAKLRREFKLR